MTLNIAKINRIIELHNAGYYQRDIADKLRVSKTTVNKYINLYSGNQLINPVTVAKKTNLNKGQVVDIPYTPPIQPLPYNPMYQQRQYQQNYVGYGSDWFRDQMMPQEQIQQQLFEDQRLEREKNRKHDQDLDDKLRLLKQAYEEKISQEREALQMNQLQNDIKELENEQQHTREAFESRNESLKELLLEEKNKNMEKKAKLESMVSKLIQINEDLDNKENPGIDDVKTEEVQSPRASSVVLQEVTTNNEPNLKEIEEAQDVEGLPNWVKTVVMETCFYLIKKGLNHYNSSFSKQQNISQESGKPPVGFRKKKYKAIPILQPI